MLVGGLRGKCLLVYRVIYLLQNWLMLSVIITLLSRTFCLIEVDKLAAIVLDIVLNEIFRHNNRAVIIVNLTSQIGM